jgi:hypothetical protein
VTNLTPCPKAIYSGGGYHDCRLMPAKSSEGNEPKYCICAYYCPVTLPTLRDSWYLDEKGEMQRVTEDTDIEIIREVDQFNDYMCTPEYNKELCPLHYTLDEMKKGLRLLDYHAALDRRGSMYFSEDFIEEAKAWKKLHRTTCKTGCSLCCEETGKISQSNAQGSSEQPISLYEADTAHESSPLKVETDAGDKLKKQSESKERSCSESISLKQLQTMNAYALNSLQYRINSDNPDGDDFESKVLVEEVTRRFLRICELSGIKFVLYPKGR